jgi:hypothetical protein
VTGGVDHARNRCTGMSLRVVMPYSKSPRCGRQGMAAARSLISVVTRVSKRARSDVRERRSGWGEVAVVAGAFGDA